MSNIKLCPSCAGSGDFKEDVGTHNTEWEWHTCGYCNGTGRIISGIYTYEVPYDTDLHKFVYPADNLIVQTINELHTKTRGKKL